MMLPCAVLALLVAAIVEGQSPGERTLWFSERWIAGVRKDSRELTRRRFM